MRKPWVHSWHLCSICRRRLYRRATATDAGNVDVYACEHCDRLRCRQCGEAFGNLLEPHGSAASLDGDTALCPACTATSPAT